MQGLLHRVIPALAALLLFIVPAAAGQGNEGIVSLHVQPVPLLLVGPGARQQLVITGVRGDGKVQDLTRACRVRAQNPAVVAVGADHVVRPTGNGSTYLLVQANGLEERVLVRVMEQERQTPVRFRHDVMAVLNVGGCNAGACHGTPSGKNGFHLSLRGEDPDADYLRLTRELFARRTDRLRPEQSLIYLKALGRVEHGGKVRFPATSLPANLLRRWLEQGRTDDPEDLPTVQKLDIFPGDRILHAPAKTQQLAVRALFSDGTLRDVTPLTVFSTSDRDIATVSPGGLVTFHRTGEIAVLCRYLQTLETMRLVHLAPRDGFAWPDVPEYNFVDRHVYAKLKMMSLPPSPLCSDEVFIRRAYLDLCAILPTPREVRAFLKDRRKDKRERLIEHLLGRDEYADFWALKWMDVLRGSSKLLGRQGADVYQRWLREHLRRNTPLDQVVRDLLTASGDTFRVGPANYFRTAEDARELAEMTAQVFLGVRMQCARCHNHPFEKWTQEDYYGLSAFFAQVKISGKRLDKNPRAVRISIARGGEVHHPRTGKVVLPRLLGQGTVSLEKGQDRRQALAAWVTSADNEFFARSVVNRVWYHLMGKGIVDPVDDFRDSNPAANEELLDALASDFVAHHFDLRHLIRTIMRSCTYQLSSRTTPLNRDDDRYFSHPPPRMLTAEQMLDAICQVTEVPEKYPGMPAGTRAVQLPVGELRQPFLKVFGKPAREISCECERNQDASLARALELIGGNKIQEKVVQKNNRIGRLLAAKRSKEEIMEEIFLVSLARFPRPDEAQTVLKFLGKEPDARKAWEDIQWAIFNTKEFLFRH